LAFFHALSLSAWLSLSQAASLAASDLDILGGWGDSRSVSQQKPTQVILLLFSPENNTDPSPLFAMQNQGGLVVRGKDTFVTATPVTKPFFPKKLVYGFRYDMNAHANKPQRKEGIYI
jgi:hypothetical protein